MEEEIAGAGLDLGEDTPARREFDALRVIPHAVDLADDVRTRLSARLLRRPRDTDAEAEKGRNNSAADLLPALAVRVFGVRITVVGGDGGFQDFAPPEPRPNAGLLQSVLDVAGQHASRTPAHVVLSLADGHYRLAVPVKPLPAEETVEPPGKGHETHETAPGPVRRFDDAMGGVRKPGAHAVADDAAAEPVPRVSRTESQRLLAATLVTAADLPEVPPLLGPDETVTAAELSRAGVMNPGAVVQATLNGTLRVRDSGIEPLDHVRLLMVRTGPWSVALDAVAARASRRVWRSAYEEFVLTVSPGSGMPALDPTDVWRRAVALVLPSESHPVLGDSRYAGSEFRDAVREMAERLAAQGRDARPGGELVGGGGGRHAPGR
ncbi:hypothetical protein ACIOJD_25260 [Streptomyces sp. NPDC088116]|uniref:hypothetical protein n=1 Tax=Streptomyces sp. NPDC088116 TaxID=3365825 RepID=UPI0038256381